MHFDFDTVIDRRNTNSIKFDCAEEMGKPADVLPLWVADMDFQCPPSVQAALKKASAYGIFGYSKSGTAYDEAVAKWFDSRFHWQIDPSWICKMPGVVFALANAVRAFTQPGDAILIQTPVYYPFYSVIQKNGRNLVENPLVYANGTYTVDFEDLEQKISDHQVKMMILCSPHNPICRVWTRDELQKVGAICKKHGVIVVSDEIHCDFTYPGHDHTLFPVACPDLQEQCIVCTAPSKTFNLAGLQASNIIIPGEKLRAAFNDEFDRCAASGPNLMGLIACQAAYEGGEAWLDECKQYIQGNLDYVRAFLQENIPQIKLVEPEGTYFAWLDCTELGLNVDELEDLILHNAKLWLDGGGMFGEAAGLFQRVVLACPRAMLQRAMARLKAAVDSLE